jgi:2-methylisocitrate lyase-like PEP mutase family enzyme
MPRPAGPRRLRELLARPGIIQSLGAHDVFTALIIEDAGFDTVFIGGFGTSASLLGLPDLDLLTLTEMADAVRRMAARVSIPVIADGDTGHGGLAGVARTVELFELAGAAGVLLEDQTAPKRCGHFAGKEVIPAAEMARKIEAAVRARSNPDFVIIGRTDARQGHGLDEAIDRANRYGEAGADVLFVEAPQSLVELEEIPRRLRRPALANMLTGGVTPILPAADLDRLGYKFAVSPIESLLVCGRALRDLCAALRKEGRADGVAGRAMGLEDLKRLLGVERYLNP